MNCILDYLKILRQDKEDFIIATPVIIYCTLLNLYILLIISIIYLELLIILIIINYNLVIIYGILLNQGAALLPHCKIPGPGPFCVCVCIISIYISIMRDCGNTDFSSAVFVYASRMHQG